MRPCNQKRLRTEGPSHIKPSGGVWTDAIMVLTVATNPLMAKSTLRRSVLLNPETEIVAAYLDGSIAKLWEESWLTRPGCRPSRASQCGARQNAHPISQGDPGINKD